MMGDTRLRPIVFAYLTTGFSKIATAAVQLFALPVVATSLGVERLGALLLLGSIASFLSLPGQGLAPSASYSIAYAHGREDPDLASRQFWNLLILSFSAGLVALTLCLIAFLLAEPSLLLPAASEFAAELRLGFLALIAHVVFYYFFAFAEGARAAHKQNHITNIFTTVSSLAVLATVLLASKFAASIAAFYVAIFVIPPFFQGLNLALLLWSHRRELGRCRIDRAVLKTTARRAVSVSKAQAGLSLYLHGSVFAVAQLFGLQASALLGGVVRLFIVVHSLLLSMLNPILPTISRAVASGDYHWVLKAVRAVSVGTFVVLVIFGGLFAIAGEWLLLAWLGLTAASGISIFFGLALMGVSYMAAHSQFSLLVGLGESRKSSVILLAAGLTGTLSASILGYLAGMEALIFTQAAVMSTLGFLPLAAMLRRRAGLMRMKLAANP